MSGFEFQVRTPLHSKQGLVVEKRPDGTHRDVNLSLVWPRLVITVGAKKIECGQEIIENAVVHAFPQLDGHVDGHLNGKKGYAFQCVHRRDSTTTTYFADSQEDRHEWCKLLRKHAVHHNIDNGFEVTKKVLGTGAYATVYLAKDRRSNEVVALKLITRERVVEEERKLLRQEVWVSQFLKTKYLVGTSEFIENRHSYVLVMEYVAGGELFERLIQRPFSEKEVQSIMRQVLKGVVHMHQKNIVHFDLKPENFLIVSDNPMSIKIADFGVSMDLNSKTPLTRKACFKSKGLLRCSPGYGAPEIASMQDCGAPADMWSMGVVMYVLLTRHQPFLGSTDEETRLLMVEGKYDSAPLEGCSLLATDLLARLLDKNTKYRMTAAQAMEHPWIKHDGTALGPGGPGGVRRSLTDFSVRKVGDVDVARWGMAEEEGVGISGGCCGIC